MKPRKDQWGFHPTLIRENPQSDIRLEVLSQEARQVIQLSQPMVSGANRREVVECQVLSTRTLMMPDCGGQYGWPYHRMGAYGIATQRSGFASRRGSAQELFVEPLLRRKRAGGI